MYNWLLVCLGKDLTDELKLDTWFIETKMHIALIMRHREVILFGKEQEFDQITMQRQVSIKFLVGKYSWMMWLAQFKLLATVL